MTASTTKLQVLGVGTGRDGTASLTEIVNRIYALNGVTAAAFHEYAASESYVNFCEFRETGKHKYLGQIEHLIRDCPYDAVIGNGYAFVLDLFARVSRGQLKLVHIRRRDRDGCIRSIVENTRLFPLSHGYYSDSAEAKLKRTAAFHLDEMTREAWDELPLPERVGWYFDATHRLIEAQKSKFADCVVIETEAINTAEALSRLTEFVLGRPGVVPEPVHLNKYDPLDYKHLPAPDRAFLHYSLHTIDVAAAAADEAYLIKHTSQRFINWWYHILGHREDFPAKDDAYLLRKLDEAAHQLEEKYREIQHAKTVLAAAANRRRA